MVSCETNFSDQIENKQKVVFTVTFEDIIIKKTNKKKY